MLQNAPMSVSFLSMHCEVLLISTRLRFKRVGPNAMRGRGIGTARGRATIMRDFPTHDLPLYTPLSHDNPFFTAEIFDVEKFLLSRSHISLPDLRSELRDYQAELKEELVKLINDDYEAFISLSTDLRGEGVRLERLKYPLRDLISQVQESRRDFQLILDDVQSKLKARSALRDEEALHQLLLKISESVSRLESLLLIASPDGNRAKHLARVAAEYTQLLYHVTKAQINQRPAFIDDIYWRIERIKSSLSSDLDHLFANTLSSLTNAKEANLTECLQTYDILGLWRDAEAVVRRELVHDFVKKSVYIGSMTAPQTPLLPRTPFPIYRSTEALTHPPRTPYTPFTAFASKQNPFESAITSVHLLDDTDNPLAGLYNTVLKFVERDLKRIMDLAEKVSVKHGAKAKVTVSERSSLSQPMREESETFEFLANAVWAELGRAIMDELGAVVFAAGNPDEFHKNYETTKAFIRSLQLLAPSLHSVEAMIAHPVYTAFERRWQLHVYFQLRWKEIVTKLEEPLSTTKIEPISSKDIQPFMTLQSAAVWTAMETCWSREVYIPELSHRFWKTTLQGGTAESVVADDTLIAQCAAAVTDINAMQSRVSTLWHALRLSLQELTSLIPPMSTNIVTILSKRCCEALTPVRSIPSQFRAMSNKRMPTDPSYFVGSILRPVKAFFAIGTAEGPGQALKSNYLKSYSEEVFENVIQRYIYYLAAMKKTEESLRRLKKGKKSTFSLFGNATTDKDDDNRDEERIRTQMILDVEAFGRDAESLSVDIKHSASFKSLDDMVHTGLSEGQPS
ncbi:hypothetical protein HETIRDRAFT_154913 [Heterobasidion irregulare TC 32-1]|uniref:Conserved oligomeric Golgi complex subunit 2 n=1 Tax=Heterobasidion irregulare (strain TC 32-1) TaxID=747525 RepID=W4K5Y3_HETIT|nr:uncharacterized protein HETIRDRAFT_154913 [Heterobasidion irregulare TC 32-1]ETW80755.1 hypothetical protein HETIRDRAFT_154913 [Heterobasidion irregulare TC 32-1]